MNTVSSYFFRFWRVTVLLLSLAIIAYVLYFHRLGNLLPGFSTPELTTLRHTGSLHAIMVYPVYAPYELLVWLLRALGHHGIIITRVAAACFGVLAVLAFTLVIKPWYSFRTAFLGTLLFATSAGFLHYARFGSGQILQMSILGFIGAVLWYRHHERHRVLIGYGVGALFALLWYVPGMVWFELFGVILLHKGILRQLRSMPTNHIIGWGALFTVIILPLAVAWIKTPHLLLVSAGLPQTAHALVHTPANTLNALLSIGIYSNRNPLFWVGHAPLLDIVELTLGGVGLYSYLYRDRSRRGVFLAGSVVIGLVLVGFGGGVSFACLIPLLYLFVVAGLDGLLSQWLSVFPRNPIARFAGIGLVALMLFFSVLYQTRSYFIAWPHNSATRQAFDHQ